MERVHIMGFWFDVVQDASQEPKSTTSPETEKVPEDTGCTKKHYCQSQVCHLPSRWRDCAL